MEPVLPEIKCIKFLKIIAKYPEYREFRKKHWHRQIRTFPEYLRCNISKISDRFMGIIRGQRDIFRRMLRWGIRGLMAFLVILIICYLIALAILALGKLIEPVVGPILAVEKLVELVVGPIFAIGKLIEPVINPIMPSSDNIPPIVNSIKSALNSVWISFGDIDYKNSDITSIIEILAGLLVAILLTSIFKEDESLLVLPFNVKLEGAKSEEVILSGKFVQDQFIANLNKILWTHSTKHERILPETIHTENETLPKLNPLNESLTYNLAELGTISAGPFGLSIGQILLMLKQLCPLAKPGTIIKGSVYQCGSEISLVATIGPKGGSNESPSWDIRRSFKGKTIEHEKILDLIRDLAYQVAYKFISDSPPKNWAAFKYFTEALYAYSQYTLTEDDKNLKLARERALKAINASPNYKNVFPLIYNLGLAYYNKKWYEEAEKLFRMLVILNRDSDDAYRGWGMSLRRLSEDDRNDMALICYKRALEILENKSKLHLSPPIILNKGIIYRQESDYDTAIKHFENALEIDPNYGFAWGNLGNTLEVASRLCGSRALYMLLKAFKSNVNSNDQVKKIDKVLCNWTKRLMTDNEALEELVGIAAKDASCCYKEGRDLSESLYRLSRAMRKNRIAMDVEAKQKDLKDKTRTLIKSLRKTKAETESNKKLFEDKYKNLVENLEKSRQVLARLLEDDVIHVDLSKDLKKKCESINNLCEKTKEIFKDEGEALKVQANDMANDLEDAIGSETSKPTKEKCKKIKKETIGEMYKALTEIFCILGLPIRDILGIPIPNILGKYIVERKSFEEKIMRVIGEVLKSKGVSNATDIIETAKNSEYYKTRAINAYMISTILAPEYIVVLSSLARLHKKDGEVVKTSKECDGAETLIRMQNEYNRACHYAICGDTAEAFESLRRALAKKQTTISWLVTDPDLEDIRKDPRFEDLQRDFKDVEDRIGIRPSLSRAARYKKLHKYERKKSECEKLRKIIDTESSYHRAIFEAICGNDLDGSLVFLRIALRNGEITSDEVMGNPDFESIRDEPEFRSLLEEFSEGSSELLKEKFIAEFEN